MRKQKARKQQTDRGKHSPVISEHTAPDGPLRDEERGYLDRATDEVRAILGDKEAAQRRKRDLKRLSRGGGTYKGTYDQASMRGFDYGMPESNDEQS